MLKQNMQGDAISVISGKDIDQILSLAQKSHENYLISSDKTDLDNALLYYYEVIKLNPAISDVYYKLACLLWEKGDIDLNIAVGNCKKAIELDPKSSNARLYMGYFLKAAGNFEEAEDSFKSSIKFSGFKSSKARIALSLTIIQRLRSGTPNWSDFIKAMYYLVSGVLMASCDYDIVKTLYKSSIDDFYLYYFKFKSDIYKRLGNYPKTIKTCKDAAAKTGQKDLFYTKIGDMLLELHNPQRAADFYREVLVSSPDNIVLWAKLADILQNFDKHNVEEIIYCYKKLAVLEPINSGIFYELGHLYLQKEDRFSAVNSFKKAIEIEPENAFYHNSLAYTLVQLQDYDGAISEYMRAIRLNPDSEWTSIVCQALGAIYHQVKDNIDAAIVSYQNAIILDPKNVDAYMALGEAYQDKNDLDNTIDCYCHAAKLDPNCPRLFCNLGLTLWEKGYIDEAIVAYHKAININPKYEIAFNNLGVVYLDGTKSTDEAIVMFTQAIKHNPNYALAYYNKGRAYHTLKNKTEAARYYQMAIDINKITEEIDESEVQERLYSLFAVS